MVGKHIRKYRAAKKITQEQLAEHLNVTRQFRIGKMKKRSRTSICFKKSRRYWRSRSKN